MKIDEHNPEYAYPVTIEGVDLSNCFFSNLSYKELWQPVNCKKKIHISIGGAATNPKMIDEGERVRFSKQKIEALLKDLAVDSNIIWSLHSLEQSSKPSLRRQAPAIIRRALGGHKELVKFYTLPIASCEHEQNEISHILEKVASIAHERLLSMQESQMAQLVDSLITKPAATPLMMRKAMMEAQAKEAVMQSGRYLTSQQLAEVAGLSPTNPSAQPNKWKSAGRLFAVNFKGTDYYPDFGLDPEDNYRPYDGLKPILEVFSDKKSPWKIAFWFQSPNGTLNFRAPQDVLQAEPNLVLAAAREEVQGVQHG